MTTLPTTPQFPSSFDTDNNLYLVHDSLRVTLVNDYLPGDTSITVTGDTSHFPPTGLITLTEQCNQDVTVRAISFYYGSKTSVTFDNLILLPNFKDTSKPKNRTDVTMNVMAQHHNTLKDALIAIENFLGVKGTTDTTPFGPTLEGRVNFLRKLVLSPRAWFSSDKRIGVVPFTVCFTDQSYRNPTAWTWDFGDGTSMISSSVTPSTSYIVPSGASAVVATDAGPICKTYYTPGKYDVTLVVSNAYGSDTIVVPELITARAPAPDAAQIVVSPSKTATNSLVDIEITSDGAQSDDPIISYTWNLSDDLPHSNTPSTLASYSIGGLYDVKLRVDTTLGAYRITSLPNAINVVESVNLWLMLFDSPKSTLAVTKNLQAYEFGLISEAFKVPDMPVLSVSRDYTFTTGYVDASYQQTVFLRNASIAARNTATSGNNGQALMYWAKNATTVQFQQFQPFSNLWTAPAIGGSGNTLSLNWNWTSFNTSNDVNMVFGVNTVQSSPTQVSQNKNRISLVDYSVTTTAYTSGSYLNGAAELNQNPDSVPSTYRSTFQSGTGFLARNDAGPGGFFRISSFYTAGGVLSNYIQSFLKVADIPGTTKTELELVALSGGIYVFNNSGEVALYNPNANTWSTGGPGVGSAAFRSLQDATVTGFADLSQPLRAASDGGHRAYISFDYSANAFIKFDETNLTFSSLGSRPNSNEQFLMSVY